MFPETRNKPERRLRQGRAAVLRASAVQQPLLGGLRQRAQGPLHGRGRAGRHHRQPNALQWPLPQPEAR